MAMDRKFWHDQVDACVGKGWHDLVHPLIDEVFNQEGQVHQIKEKFGGLRFYYGLDDLDEETPEETAARQKLRTMVMDAEEKSTQICEECGMPGFTSGKTWLKTLCTVHHAGRERH